MESLFGFALAGFAIIGGPGPGPLSIAAASAAFGPRQALGYMCGAAAGMFVVLAVTASGVQGVLLALPGAVPVVAALAGGYLVYLAYRIATAPPLSEGGDRGKRPSFVGGMVMSVCNPKAYAGVAALLSGFVLTGDGPALAAALKIGFLAAVVVIVDVAWLFVGVALTRFFRSPRTNRVINVTFAVLLIASVGSAFLF